MCQVACPWQGAQEPHLLLLQNAGLCVPCDKSGTQMFPASSASELGMAGVKEPTPGPGLPVTSAVGEPSFLAAWAGFLPKGLREAHQDEDWGVARVS